MTSGYLTVAARHRMYLEMAVDLALSLRERNPEPISIVVDARLKKRAERFHSVFDQILDLPPGYDFGRALKYCVAEVTPYDRTLFIDADSLALDSLEDTWRRLDSFEFAMMGQTLDADDDRLHHGRPVREWSMRFGLKQYFKTASAVFFFEKGRGREILAECLASYRDRAHSRLRWTGDEIGFAIAAERTPIPTFPRPWPVIWSGQLVDLDLEKPKAPLLTALGTPPEPIMDRLMRQVVARRRAAGLPVGSEAYWQAKFSLHGRAKHLLPLRRRIIDLRLTGT